MINKQQLLYTCAIALTASIGTYVVGQNLSQKQSPNFTEQQSKVHTSFANYSPTGGVDFQQAAQRSIPAVVHIKTAISGRTITTNSYDPFDFFGGERRYYQPPQLGSGSGVIISQDGYIVTNNHVVASAEEIQVTLANGREYIGTLVGKDPSTDIAVIKIEEKNLPTLDFVNSDNVNIGQWVLAVGYPLNLDATVTAGIVSAKSRNLGINNRQSNNSVESFIQTDAAVNQGNSGGALVNLDGDLIGINSAIASPTGSYAGYSYAIPSNIAKKIVDDLIKYGEAKRGYIGVYYVPLSPKINEEYGLASNEQGILINEVIKGGAADKAGLQEGDIIQQINGSKTSSDSRFREKVATLDLDKPATITYKRRGQIKTASVIPTENMGKTEKTISSSKPSPSRAKESYPDNQWYNKLKLKQLSSKECKDLGIDGGLEVLSTDPQSRLGNMIEEGSVITSINGQPVSTEKELKQLAAESQGIEIGGLNKSRNGKFYIQIN